MRFRALSLVFVCAAMAFAQKTDKKKDPAEIGNRKVATGPNFFSVEKELALGQQLALEVEKQAKLYSDPILTEYVNRLAQNLVRHSDVTFPVTVKILDADQPNAFTLPGGHVFVATGLIRLSESEAELASVIAHELGHVAARHATREATRERIAGATSIPLVLLGGPIASLAARQAIPLGFLKFSRVAENEADMLGLQYLYDTGYDPSAAVDIFERMEALERKRPGAVGQLFKTHPMTSDRIAKTQKNIDQMLPARSEYIVNTSEYEDIRKRLVSRREKPKDEKRPTLIRPSEPPANESFRPEKDELRP
ncbi:MAG: peptidase Ste24p [Bryobacterales bacterium]|nr:peptidase Ste24p [Bryobacterales bacterium]